MSPDDDKDVDDFENDLLADMEEKAPAPATESKKSYLDDPAYHQLVATRDRLQKSLRDSDRAISDYAVKVQANANIVMKVCHKLHRMSSLFTVCLTSACAMNRTVSSK